MPTTVDQYEGVILRVHANGYAFIGCVGKPDAFAHFGDFVGFEELGERLKGRRVLCCLRRGVKGYEAYDVRPAD